MLRAILAIICPPLAVLVSGTRTQVVLNTCLTLLLFVPGIIHALSIVDQYNVERRYENVMRALS